MMKKKWILVLLSLLLCLTLCACAGDNGDTQEGSDTTAPTDTQAETTPPVADILLQGGAEDYVIVFPSKASADLKEIMKSMSDGAKTATGKKLEYHTDETKNNPEVAKEILLGVTNRDESKASLEQITGYGYRIEVIGEKLVITGSNDTFLQDAVTELMKAWTAADGKLAVKGDLKLVYEADASAVTPFIQDGEFLYTILRPAEDDVAAFYASELCDSMESLLSTTVFSRYDTASVYREGAYEILFGPTNRALSAKAYEDLGAFEYRVLIEGNQIALAAYSTDGMKMATSELIKRLQMAYNSAYVGAPVMPQLLDVRRNVDEKFSGFVGMEQGTLKGVFTAGDSYVIYRENTAKTDVESYVQSLVGAGYTVKETYNIGDNAYTLLANNKYTTYVSHLPMVNATRIYVELAGTGNYPTVKTAQAVTQKLNEPAIWQREVDAYTTRANGGMSYVIQLEDGTFLLWDSGYNTDDEADNLYQLLLDNKPASHEKPIVAGWFITHLHGDHYGGLLKFADRYADQVTVQAFYYNFPAITIDSQTDPLTPGEARRIEAAAKKFTGSVIYNKIHSGMTIGFAGAEATVICTFEDVYPRPFSDPNDTSTVVRLTVGNQSIMFLGDAREHESLAMETTIPATELACGIVQFSHHGYEGCNPKLYQLINAHTVLWPMNIISFQESYGKVINVFGAWQDNLPANRYIMSAEHVKKIILGGQGTVKLTLPYTPSDSEPRIIDHQAYFNNNKAAYEKKYFTDRGITLTF